LIKVLVELQALDNRRVRFLELVAVQTDKYGLYIVDEFINPGEVE